jgi:glyoxalase family protein
LVLVDPDGLQLELVAHPDAQARASWDGGPVLSANAIRGFHSVTLWKQDHKRTAALLTETLGFRLVQEAGERYRFQASSSGPGALVDILRRPNGDAGRGGAGTVHHVAWRTPDDAQQLAWQQEIGGLGLHVTPVTDRQYFRSIYFREPGGVLFEIATDPPGFAVDEPMEQLGRQLKLPARLEPRRAEIEQILPTLRLPQAQVS